MPPPLLLHFDQRPSALVYMARACLPSPGFEPSVGVPAIQARWINASVSPQALYDFSHLTQLAPDGTLPVLFPQTWAFRVQMAVLTHRAFPFPLWRALQIRNSLVQHRPVAPGSPLQIETRVAGQRLLDKGTEVDLTTTMRAGEELLWEGSTTFYYRRPLGNDQPSPSARAPETAGETVARWRSDSGAGYRFGRLTGDYNGVHLNDGYARLLGFRRAFHHPHRIVGQCLAQLTASGLPSAAEHSATQRLDLWLKGPVYYEADLTLRAFARDDGCRFFLFLAGDERPAIVGCWRAADEPPPSGFVVPHA